MNHTLGVGQVAQIIQTAPGEAQEIQVQAIRRMQKRLTQSQRPQEHGFPAPRRADNQRMTVAALLLHVGVEVQPQGSLRAVVHIVHEANRRAAHRDIRRSPFAPIPTAHPRFFEGRLERQPFFQWRQ